MLWQAFPAKVVMGACVTAIGLGYLVMALTDGNPWGPTEESR